MQNNRFEDFVIVNNNVRKYTIQNWLDDKILTQPILNVNDISKKSWYVYKVQKANNGSVVSVQLLELGADTLKDAYILTLTRELGINTKLLTSNYLNNGLVINGKNIVNLLNNSKNDLKVIRENAIIENIAINL